MKATVYNQKGKENGTVELPAAVFDVAWNGDLVHQIVHAMRANARPPVAHTKDRGDAAGGGKKPWRQKGTGRARHGSIRSPIWRGGGVTFGPLNERNYKKKINKKMRAGALYAVLSEKYRRGELLFVDKFEFGEMKTKDAKEVLNALSRISGFGDLATKQRNAAYITIAERDQNMEKSFANIGSVAVTDLGHLTLPEILEL